MNHDIWSCDVCGSRFDGRIIKLRVGREVNYALNVPSSIVPSSAHSSHLRCCPFCARRLFPEMWK